MQLQGANEGGEGDGDAVEGAPWGAAALGPVTAFAALAALAALGALAELAALLACVLGALAVEVLRLATVCALAGLTETPNA